VQRLGAGIPMWAVMSVAAMLLLLIYVGLKFSINAHSDDVFQTLQSFEAKGAPLAAPPPPPAPAATPRLSSLLKPDIDAGLITVRDLSGFFEPGSAAVSARVQPLLGRIQQALQGVPGQVLITGHTDNQPIRSLRYPSNWHLSQDRANAVKAQLAATLKPERLRAEGRADSEPVADNGTPAGRATNRRVEITLFVAQATGG
jgi:type VI secretion system protein ImpK